MGLFSNITKAVKTAVKAPIKVVAKVASNPIKVASTAVQTAVKVNQAIVGTAVKVALPVASTALTTTAGAAAGVPDFALGNPLEDATKALQDFANGIKDGIKEFFDFSAYLPSMSTLVLVGAAGVGGYILVQRTIRM